MKTALTALFLLLTVLPARSVSAHDPENMNLYREFVRLLNYGQEDEFYAQAARYEQFLKDHQMHEEYYKIKTNEGFFDVNHFHPFRAMQTANQLDEELRAAGDSAFYYLATGLKGDIFKIMHHPKADSTYMQALREVGDRDPKFVMLVHMSLAQVHYMTDPGVALDWANRALEEAEILNNYEYRSMALGMKAYLYFMMNNRNDFEDVVERYNELKLRYDSLEASGGAMGRQRFSHRYDAIIEVGKTAFAGRFQDAIDIAEREQLNVEHQSVIFRIFGMEGQMKTEQSHRRLIWGFVAMTALYVFVYIMGRRRLMLKIWKRERELKVALEKADEGNRIKAAFIRSMSHEIRTPLNAINGFSQILCSTDFELTSDEKADLRQRITSSSEAITIIINELLELAAGESVTLERDALMPVKVNEVCRIATAMAEEHNEKGLALEFTTELTDDETVQSNSEMLTQILDKIIDNALKFTEQGSVEVHASKDGGGQVLISITDTGPGVPANRQADIFENFVKLDEYKEGIGLGLPICRRLVKTLGGNIVIDPAYKNGSRFIVQLPL
ncbi:MAG: HAMP domain-containing histidine kinase [Prevotella sp.]|nr:HAMP domain-containing histidine kinase [Prevotella sp.]